MAPFLDRKSELRRFADSETDDCALLFGRVGGRAAGTWGIGNDFEQQAPKLRIGWHSIRLSKMLDQHQRTPVPTTHCFPGMAEMLRSLPQACGAELVEDAQSSVLSHRGLLAGNQAAQDHDRFRWQVQGREGSAGRRSALASRPPFLDVRSQPPLQTTKATIKELLYSSIYSR